MFLGCQHNGHEPICHDLPQFAAVQLFGVQNAITKDVKGYRVIKLAIFRPRRLAPRNKARPNAANRSSKNARCCPQCHPAKFVPFDLPEDGIENF
jgi:hypothetical protein